MADIQFQENYRGAMSNYQNAQARAIRAQSLLDSKIRQKREQLEAELTAKYQEKEGRFGDFLEDKKLRPEYDLELYGDPERGIPSLAQRAEAEARQEFNQQLATPDPNNPNWRPESFESIIQEYQVAAQEAAPFLGGEGTPTTRYTRTPEQRTADLAAQRKAAEDARLDRAEEAVRSQREYKQRYDSLRDQNVVDAAKAAMAEGSEGIEAFTRQIENISDPKLRADTIGIARDAGVEFQRPIQLRGEEGVDPTQLSSVEYPTTQVEGGAGYWQRADGTFTVQAPSGFEFNFPTEDEAKQMMASFNQVAADNFAKPERIAQIQKAAEAAGYQPPVAAAEDDVTTAIPEDETTALNVVGAAAKVPAITNPVMNSNSKTGVQRLRDNKGRLTKEMRPATVREMVDRKVKKVTPAVQKATGLIPEGLTSTVSKFVGGGQKAADAVGALIDKSPIARKVTDVATGAAKGAAGFAGRRVVPAVGGAITGSEIADDFATNVLGREATDFEKRAGAILGGAAGMTPYGAAFGLGYDVADMTGLDEAGAKLAGKAAEGFYGDGSQPAIGSVLEMERDLGRQFSDEERENISRNMGIPIVGEPEIPAMRDPAALRGFGGL